MMKRQRIKILIVVVALILVCVALYSGLQYLESTVLLNEQVAEESRPSKTITSGETDYFPRQDITTLLILGIDETGPVRDSMSYNNEGESDVVLLVIFDELNKKYDVLALNRDTMVDVPIIGLGGKKAGTKVAQLAVAHTYGTGLHDSCEYACEAVSGLLGGDFIDYYVSMNMDAVPILNDAVGGVSVVVTDDFSAVDPSIQQGEVLLRGQQALHYVQMRRDVGTQMNISRMERQREYMNGFVAALNQKLGESTSFVFDVYEELTPYIVTDCSVNTLSMLVNRFAEYEMGQIVTPEGENQVGDTFMEFYLDPEKMEELTLQLFYAAK